MRRLPILSTIIVAAAVATMIGLGVWQLQRAEWKKDLIAELEASGEQRSSVSCAIDAAPEVRAGRSVDGQSGYRYLVPCGGALLDIGWSKRPDLLSHVGRTGTFTGVYTPGTTNRTLVLEEPFPPLERSGLPSAADLPNNHLSYAVQWFLFALTAAVIYILALRRRQRP